jgi:hypothetical protein
MLSNNFRIHVKIFRLNTFPPYTVEKASRIKGRITGQAQQERLLSPAF